MQWYLAVLKNYVGFSGRARRKEYWMFTLINAIVGAIINVIQLILGLEFPFLSHLPGSNNHSGHCSVRSSSARY